MTKEITKKEVEESKEIREYEKMTNVESNCITEVEQEGIEKRTGQCASTPQIVEIEREVSVETIKEVIVIQEVEVIKEV